MNSHNIVISEDGKFEIYIPACTKEWANVVISHTNGAINYRWGNYSVMRQVNLKTFKLAEGERRDTPPGAMALFEYLDVLHNNKEVILQLCRRLNSV